MQRFFGLWACWNFIWKRRLHIPIINNNRSKEHINPLLWSRGVTLHWRLVHFTYIHELVLYVGVSLHTSQCRLLITIVNTWCVLLLNLKDVGTNCSWCSNAMWLLMGLMGNMHINFVKGVIAEWANIYIMCYNLQSCRTYWFYYARMYVPNTIIIKQYVFAL